jgi:hypothetical protein
MYHYNGTTWEAFKNACLLLGAFIIVYTPVVLVVLSVIGRVEWEIAVIAILSLSTIMMTLINFLLRIENDELHECLLPPQ